MSGVCEIFGPKHGQNMAQMKHFKKRGKTCRRCSGRAGTAGRGPRSQRRRHCVPR